MEAKQDTERALKRKTAKQKRGYHRILSGAWKHRNERLYRLDLTLDKSQEPKFSQYWQTLRKRVQRKWGFIINYVSVKAKGDKGGKLHLHILYSVSFKNGIPLGQKLAWIPHPWITQAWRQITQGSSINFIQTVKDRVKDRHRGPKRIAGYFIGQYFSGQNNYERMSYSWKWGFKGMAKVWNEEYAPLYQLNPTACIEAWHSRIDQVELTPYIPNG